MARRGACWDHFGPGSTLLGDTVDDSIPWSWLVGFRYRIRDLRFIKNRGRRPSAIFTIPVLPTLPRDAARYLLLVMMIATRPLLFLHVLSPNNISKIYRQHSFFSHLLAFRLCMAIIAVHVQFVPAAALLGPS